MKVRYYVGQLRTAIQEEDHHAKRAASLELRELGEDAIPALIPLFEDDSEDIRWSATELLKPAREKAVGRLIECLSSPRQATRYHGSLIILWMTFADGWVVDQDVLEPATPDLIALLTDPDKGIRGNAAKALKKLGTTPEKYKGLVEAVAKETKSRPRRPIRSKEKRWKMGK